MNPSYTNKGFPEGTGSDGTNSSTSQNKAQSEDDSDNLPPNDSSTAFGTSPTSSGNPDGKFTLKTRLFSDEQRQDIGSEIYNEIGTTQNYGHCASYTPFVFSAPRTPVLSGYQFQPTKTPDITQWLQTLPRGSKIAAACHVADFQTGTSHSASAKTKQNPTDLSAGELLQKQTSSQLNDASDASQVLSKKEDSEDHSEDSKGFPHP